MKILVLTTLYPNAATPHHGVFVENRLRAFREHSGAELRVVAPVPWFPSKSRAFGRYADFARAPLAEIRHGVPVTHPRYFVPPKIGMTLAAATLERAFTEAAHEARRDGFDFDLIDAHYLYPDGVAAANVAALFHRPLILTARGTDVSLIPNFPAQRRMILDAISAASQVICVAAALRDELIRLGAPGDKISVLRNGVDLAQFRPLDRAASRRTLGLADADNTGGAIIASVGHLIARKGHDLAIEALADLPGVRLIIVGKGEERAALERLAASRGVADRVRFLGALPHEELAAVYSASDALVLASSREGWPNVLLEAMACGTPVVAAPVWGCAEVVRAPAAGIVAGARSREAIATALRALLAAPPTREATRTYAEDHSWTSTSAGLERVFTGAINDHRANRAVLIRPTRATIRAEAPTMIVTVDTEEAFDWGQFPVLKTEVCPYSDLMPFQRLCEDAGARPLYFVTYPLLNHDEVGAGFARLAAEGRADFGIHLHEWVTPPLGEPNGAFFSFQTNLPASLHAAKLDALEAAFLERFGRPASAHRAGRYGLSPKDYAALARNGVRFDFSPSPGFDQTSDGGPDFTVMSNRPFEVTTEDGTTVYVTPVCGARALKHTQYFLSQEGDVDAIRRRQFSRWSAPLRLTCEGTKLSDLKALTRHFLRENVPVLTFSLHSTTLTVGGSPYSQSEGAVAHALDLTRAYFEFFRTELGGRFISLDGLAELYGAKRETSSPGASPTLAPRIDELTARAHTASR